MLSDGLGVSFAPTAEAALNAPRQAGIEGVPEAIRILSMRLPKFLGARAVAPAQLLNASGAQGVDPFTAVIQTLAASLGGGLPAQPATAPGGFGGGGLAPSTNAGAPMAPAAAPPYQAPAPDSPLQLPPPAKPPRIVTQDSPAPDGGATGLGPPGGLVTQAPLGTADLIARRRRL